MRLQNKTILASILLFLISFVSLAQGGNPPPPMPPPPPGLPIDNFLPFFFIFAIAYGVYRNLKPAKN